jgi:hypothetical protein
MITKKADIFPRRVQLVIDITKEGRNKIKSYVELMKEALNQIED